MNKKPIKVYEHESLKVDGKVFTSKHLELLSNYLGEREGDDFPYYSLINNGVKFKQYVGVLSVGDIHIEVLPKADNNISNNDKNVWEQHLLEMLQVVYKMRVSAPTKAKQHLKHSHVLDIFLSHFLEDVEHLMHMGLVKAYRRTENNCSSLKGRLVMSKHLSTNTIHKERFYNEYTTYDNNHIFNRILYKTLRIIPDIAANDSTIQRAKTLLFEFPVLNDIIVSEELFNRQAFDRKTDAYREVMEFAKLILLNYMPNLAYNHRDSVMALMFDMNKLWEEYVYVMLKRKLRNKYVVLAQNSKRFWSAENVGLKTIRPDIVIMSKDNNQCIAVFDTKWKCPKDGKPSDSDLKQMYVYHDYWKTERTALLYPGVAPNVDGNYYNSTPSTNNSKHCSLVYLSFGRGKGSLDFDVIEDILEPQSKVNLDS